MRIGTSRAGVPALVMLCLLLAACGSGSDSSASEPEIGAIPVIRDTAELALPLDAYSLNSQEYSSVRRAAWRLTRDCVTSFGGEYTVPAALLLRDVPQFPHPHDRRYGLYDESSASARGYNVAQDQQPPTEGKTLVWDPSPAEMLLVRGYDKDHRPAQLPRDTAGRELPPGGCQGEADRILADGTPVPPDQELGNKLAFDANKQALNDSRVRAAMKKWSECMAQRGYHYDTIMQPNDEPWPEPAEDKEIATAVADVRCKHETNLLGTLEAVEAGYHRRMIDEHGEELAAVQTHARKLASSAAHVLSGG